MTPEEIAELGPVEKLFLDISNRLATIEDLRWIDLECGQLELPEDSYPVQFPCALIDFPDAGFQDESQNNQQGLMTIQIRLGIDLYEDLHMADSEPAIDRDTAVKRLGLITKIHKCLHGFQGIYFNPLQRIGFQTERRDDGLKVFALMYGCAAKDDSAANVYDSVNGPGMTFTKS